ncbi:potassium-transporting ATPase subunit KdpC [Variovorax sp. NFACC27]|uniref:potassium-transporting ATPase subunit KdpC n=1 Tax=unclassified Variovorax TaxID=663243 RepID=UPI00089C502A|nr:potassium-transporting ATPase subunit KdpC [Variovorax sp. YR750]SEF33929.1 K+-transporting ATPase ATPase C chain [Variovorax sp. NFACC28]SEG96811.1 K+-transporting ATPase ATPase C chain [Variovorax sp. NFACC29]SFD86113.1 K+-transporting ATPase ATPase C chain [Variovorax sp. NFACC26]SFH03504.1 K+-transporting ATPase ATPase C chain [Variovorax sp. NFACC27]SEM30280.1 K+-transporting ATPase ATPase C chain [Variovorax sp. YR750]
MNNNIVNGNSNGSEGGIVRPALVLFVLLSALTGLIYPMAVTGVAKTAFPAQADGSLIVLDGTTVGSKLIGQNFSDPKHFWGRPSATAPQPYNASASGGSNQGPLNPALADAVKARVEALRAADPDNTAPVPVDLVTASASGLDPDISPAAAQYQAARVARVRGMPLAQVQSLIDRNTQKPLLGFLGETRVNVLALNIALDAASGSFSPSTPR